MALGEKALPLGIFLFGVLGVVAFLSYRTNPIPNSEDSLDDETVRDVMDVLHRLSRDRNAQKSTVLIDGAKIRCVWSYETSLDGMTVEQKRYVVSLNATGEDWNSHFVGEKISYTPTSGLIRTDAEPFVIRKSSYVGAEAMLEWIRAHRNP